MSNDTIWIRVQPKEDIPYGTKIRLKSPDGDVLHGNANGMRGATVLGGRYLSPEAIHSLGFTIYREHSIPTEPGVYTVDPDVPDADLYILNVEGLWETDRDEHTWTPVEDLSSIPAGLKRLTHTPEGVDLAKRIESAIAFLHTSAFPGYPITRDRLTNILSGKES